MEITGIAGVIAKAKEVADTSNRPQEGDYQQNGIMYCGICNTPKQTIAPNPFGEPFVVGVPCKCKKQEQKQREAEKRKEHIEDMRRRAFDTDGMYCKTFLHDDGKSPELTTIARNYSEIIAQNDKAKWFGMLLYGDVDGGKSYAAAAIVNELTDRGIPCLMRTIISLGNDLFKASDKNEYLSSLDRYRLLVLDDLGAEKDTQWMLETIYQIIDYRTRSGLPMLITTNLTWDEIKNPQDRRLERIYSRIYENSYAQKVAAVNRRACAAVDRFTGIREILSKPLEQYRPYVAQVEPETDLPKMQKTYEIHKIETYKRDPTYIPELTAEQRNNRRNELLNTLYKDEA